MDISNPFADFTIAEILALCQTGEQVPVKAKPEGDDSQEDIIDEQQEERRPRK